MGATEAKSQKYDKALQLFERALQMMQKALEGSSAYAADIMDNIALMNIALGRYDTAVHLLQEAKAMKVKFLGSDSPKVADTEGNLGEAYYKMGNFKEAVIRYNEGTRICQGYFGREHPTTVRMMEDLARSYYSLGEYDAALKLYQQLLWNKQCLTTENQIETGDTLHNAAITLQAVGRRAQAMEFFQEALAIYQSCHDPGREANTVKNIGIVHSQQRNYPKAFECFTEALEIEFREYGLENPNTANTFSNLAVTFGELRKYNDSIQLWETALNITRRFLAPGSVEIGDMHHNIAMAMWMQGEGHIADVREHFDRSHRIFTSTLGKEHVKSKRAKKLLNSARKVVTRITNETRKKRARNKHCRRFRRRPRR